MALSSGSEGINLGEAKINLRTHRRGLLKYLVTCFGLLGAPFTGIISVFGFSSFPAWNLGWMDGWTDGRRCGTMHYTYYRIGRERNRV